MTNSLIGIYGASGFGREVLPLVRAEVGRVGGDSKIVFIDDGQNDPEINSCIVVNYEEFLSMEALSKSVIVAIANSKIREKIMVKINNDGIANFSVKAPNVVMMDEIEMGGGSILSPFVTLTSNITIGIAFHANIYSYVGHDCVVGDYVTFAPGVKCNGNVVIENHAYIGTGAIIKQGRPDKPLIIGEGAVVGMGAVVTKNVPAGETVIGNPAKPLSRNSLRGKN